MHFYPRSPCGERRARPRYRGCPAGYFYPRSPCGERRSTQVSGVPSSVFLSTLSLRRATPRSSGTGRRFRYFYPRSPCGERLTGDTLCRVYVTISIHALLAESDLHCETPLSTLRNFYPRSPCGERLPHSPRPHPVVNISIHALLAESDTIGTYPVTAMMCISIHALLAESDYQSPSAWCGGWNFYPRSPCGERLRIACHTINSFTQFLSTLSLRRATWPDLHQPAQT